MRRNSFNKVIASLITTFIISPSLITFAGEIGNSSNNINVKTGEKYETVKLGDASFSQYKYTGDEKEEFIIKREAMNEFEIIKPKTDSNFEIALAHSDKTYEYVDTADTLEEAMIKANNLKNPDDNETIIPSVINKDGQTVYSTNSMGRVWKHYDGKPDETFNNNSLLYPTKTIKPYAENTYINQGFVDDVPIIEDNGVVAKIQVSGYTGWINKDTSKNAVIVNGVEVLKSEFDLVIVPINHVTNPSNYYVEKGRLKHFVSTNMTAKYGKGEIIELGIAPSYLKEGVDYYSYDGIYFYTGDSILKGLTKLRDDLRNNTKKNSINFENPFYNYYNYLPYRSKSGYTADELNKYINENTIETSKLRGLGDTIIECQNKYGVNALLILATAIHESNFGKSKMAQNKNNIFGIGAEDYDTDAADIFATPRDSVIEFSNNFISKGYLDPLDWRYNGSSPGNKGIGANVRYASDPNWGEKVAKHAFNIDYQLSGYDENNLNDYNGYKLAMYTGVNTVKNSIGETLYDINATRIGKSGFVGNIVALMNDDVLKLQAINNEDGIYEIFADRNTPIGVGRFDGNYNWNNRGYISILNLKFLNTTKNAFIPGYEKEDINKNGQVNIEDLAKVAVNYNDIIENEGFKRYLDLNSDGIVDIFDLVMIAKKI